MWIERGKKFAQQNTSLKDKYVTMRDTDFETKGLMLID